MCRCEEARAVLRELANEFEPIAPHYADTALALAEALGTDASRAAELYCSVDWWGGSGSVADYIPLDQMQRRRVMRLLVDLVAAFDHFGNALPSRFSMG